MPIRTLAEAISHYGHEAYLLTVAQDGPHTSHVTIELRGSSIGCAVGASTARNIERERLCYTSQTHPLGLVSGGEP